MHCNTLQPYFIAGIFLLTLFSIPKNVLGQQVNVDSLYAILNSNQNDTLRSKAALELFRHFSRSDRNLAEKLARQTLSIAKKSKHHKSIIEAYYINGVVLELRNADIDTIISYYDKGLALLENNDNRVNKSLEAKLLNFKAQTYMRVELLDKALHVYYQALDITKKYNLKRESTCFEWCC